MEKNKNRRKKYRHEQKPSSFSPQLHEQPQPPHTMKRKRTLSYSENLRDVITIHELANGELIITTHDKITNRRTFIDDMDDEARKILNTHPQTTVCR